MEKNPLESTLNSKITVALIVIFVMLLIGCGLMSLYIYQGTSKSQKFFETDAVSSIYYEVADQRAVNKRLMKAENNSDYTIRNAYTELNPYKISPLSGIIIFQTKEKEEIKVFINDEYVTTMEASKRHTIPVWGLYEDYENIVRIESSTDIQEYKFKTEKSNLQYPLTVKENHQVTKDIYFMIASYSTHLTGWDTDGKLRFYLTENNSMDVEWLENGHFLLGTPQGQNREQYVGFVEMDYLGKIYNYYTMKNGYSFEFQLLRNGNIMAAGGNVPVYMTHSMLYQMDPKTGETVSDLDIYDIVKKIDPEFSDKYLGAAAIRNGFYLDEDTGEVVVSFRNANTIWCFDYNEKKLNWVLTDPKNPLFQNEVWKDYLVETDTGRYPLAQHSPQLFGGKLFYQNNGYDRLSVNEYGRSDAANTFKDAYTDCELLEIDRTTHKAKTVWVYNHKKQWLSTKFGYARWFEDGSKLMNFGYIVNDDYRKTDKKLLDLEKAPTDTTHRIIELDANDKVVFDAESHEGKYRAFKHKLYTDETANINVNTLNMFNSIVDDKLSQTTFRKVDLDNTVDWVNSLDFTANTFVTDYTFEKTDEVKLYFVNRAGKIYILDYLTKEDGLTARIFNVDLPSGDYALFVKVNDTLYKTNKVYTF